MDFQWIQKKKVLVAGSGGIGCELLKMLYLYGCMDVCVVDLDHIEVSNLNRQFLFCRLDMKKYKSAVAAERYRRMCPDAKAAWHVADIRTLHADFFREFSIVFNCLDNDEARSYISKRCTMFSVQLVDGGSAGMLGQSLFFGKHTECFDCMPRPRRKEVPVCTIRSFPTSFSHCVTWAKEYFLEKVAESLNKSYVCVYEELIKDEVEAENGLYVEKTLKDKLNSLFLVLSRRESMVFDKDDDVVMQFVHCCAVARSQSFGIEPGDFFSTQSIAGNIVPSVCTTNAVVAVLMILSAKRQKNFFIARDRRVLMRIETCQRSPDCTFCSKEMLILSHGGEATVQDVIQAVRVAYGLCFEMYTQDTLLYDKHYRNSLESPLPAENNSFLYANTSTRALAMYNNVIPGLKTELIELQPPSTFLKQNITE